MNSTHLKIIKEVQTAMPRCDVNETELRVVMFVDLSGSTYYKYNKKFNDGYRKTKFHNLLIKKVASLHKGHSVKEIGDEVLLVFPEPLDAVMAAIDIQNCFNAYNERYATEQDDRIYSKIGAHFGRIYREDSGDIFGSAVDIAARITNLTSDGQILISREMAELIKQEFPRITEYNVELKGLGTHTIYEVIYDRSRGLNTSPHLIEMILNKLNELSCHVKDNAMPNFLTIHKGQKEVQQSLMNLSEDIADIRIMAMSGLKIWAAGEFTDHLYRRRKPLELSILLVDPDSQYVRLRSEEYLNYTPATMRAEIQLSADKLQALVKGLAKNKSKCRVHLRYYNDPAVFRIVFLNEMLLIGGYMPNISSVFSVVYQFIDNQYSLYGYFDKYFKLVWNSSRVVI